MTRGTICRANTTKGETMSLHRNEPDPWPFARQTQSVRYLDVSEWLPSEPVILMHVLDGDRAICCGKPWTPVPDAAYRGIPRLLCLTCQRVAMDGATIR